MKMNLKKTLNNKELSDFVTCQLNQFFPDGNKIEPDSILELMPIVNSRLEYCFSHVNNKYFFDGESAIFNHLHGDQYSMFLYVLANSAFALRIGDGVPEKLFLLNKILHGIDAYFEVQLPDIFLFVHPLGTVLGRGKYANYFLVYQRCGIGSNHDVYPTLGEHVTLRPGAAVLGRSNVGTCSTIATESLLLDKDLNCNKVYIGNPRDYSIREQEAPLKIWRDF